MSSCRWRMSRALVTSRNAGDGPGDAGLDLLHRRSAQAGNRVRRQGELDVGRDAAPSADDPVLHDRFFGQAPVVSLLRVVGAVLAPGDLHTGLDADKLHLSKPDVKVFPRNKLHASFNRVARLELSVDLAVCSDRPSERRNSIEACQPSFSVRRQSGTPSTSLQGSRQHQCFRKAGHRVRCTTPHSYGQDLAAISVASVMLRPSATKPGTSGLVARNPSSPKGSICNRMETSFQGTLLRHHAVHS